MNTAAGVIAGTITTIAMTAIAVADTAMGAITAGDAPVTIGGIGAMAGGTATTGIITIAVMAVTSIDVRTAQV